MVVRLVYTGSSVHVNRTSAESRNYTKSTQIQNALAAGEERDVANLEAPQRKDANIYSKIRLVLKETALI